MNAAALSDWPSCIPQQQGQQPPQQGQQPPQQGQQPPQQVGQL
jgi:hypothetical protein